MRIGIAMIAKPLYSLIVVLVCLSLTSCVKSPPLGSVQTRHKAISLWEGTQHPRALIQHTRSAVERYGKELLTVVPKDISFYCPNYKGLNYRNRIDFWSRLLSSLAYFESEHSSDIKYTEKMLDLNGKQVISRGLLQISKESANGYGCAISNAQQLHNDKTNINCAVRILNKWVGQQDKLIVAKTGAWFSTPKWLGAARYWSPFRNKKKMNLIAAQTRQFSHCKR